MPTPQLPADLLGRPLPRREFLAGAAALAAGAAAGCAPNPLAPGRDAGSGGGPAVLRAAADAGLPDPKKSGIEHVVVVMMENRSFDHFLGWVPGADGRRQRSYTDRAGVARPMHALAPDYQGCGHPDPDHSVEGARAAYNNGACDGWLRAGRNDEFAIGYYNQADLPFFGQAVSDWTTSDRYFAAVLGPTFPNRFYQHAGQTDRSGDTFAISSLPTIWDRLAAARVSGRYYYTDLPFTALWGFRHVNISRPASEFFEACASGRLPQVSFVDQSFVGEFTGLGSDDHPHTDVRAGQQYLNRVYEAVTRGPAWDKTLLVINYDEWGGFFDHVRPEAALPVPDADKQAGLTDGLRGFRVPLLLVSPYARRRGYVGHETMDHASVLRLIGWRFGLPPLTVRDAGAANLARLLDFAHPDADAPRYAVPAVSGRLCVDNPFFSREVPAGAAAPAAGADSPAGPTGAAQRARLREIAVAHGFAVGR